MEAVKRKYWFYLFLLLMFLGLAIFVVGGTKSAKALEVPQLTARVNDYANMLSPATRQQLEKVLTTLEKEESTQIAVLTITSLAGENLEAFTLKVAETWELGQKGRDNGALLFIARDDRKLRIEVGYGLEGVLTDLTCGRIIRDIITPKFKNGNFDQGVINGVAAMIAAVHGEYSALEAASTKKKAQENFGGFLIFGLFTLNLIGRMLGRHKLLAGAIGAAIAPALGSLFFGFNWLILLALIPAGFLATYLVSALIGKTGSLATGRSSGFRHRSSGGFGGGGFGGGGFGGGGFGGGGGGFGGGGSSGGW